eukprot:jgi/Ulvmu1/2187/UM013_0033.1
MFLPRAPGMGTWLCIVSASSHRSFLLFVMGFAEWWRSRASPGRSGGRRPCNKGACLGATTELAATERGSNAQNLATWLCMLCLHGAVPARVLCLHGCWPMITGLCQ